MGKTVYTDTFKQEVLKDYSEIGPKAVSDKYGLSKHTLMQWRKKAGIEKFCNSPQRSVFRKREQRNYYTPSFKLKVVDFFDQNTEQETCDKFGINSSNIYKWRADIDKIKKQQEKDGNKVDKSIGTFIDSINETLDEGDIKIEVEEDNHDPDPIASYSHTKEKKKIEVLEYYLKFGQEMTRKKYQLSFERLHNWKKQYNDYFCGKLLQDSGRVSKEENNHRNEVLDYADENGLKAATTHYDIPITTIWAWRAKRKKNHRNQHRKSQSRLESDQSDNSILSDIQSEDSIPDSSLSGSSRRGKTWIKHDISDEKKQEIIEDYLKLGMGPTVAKHKIPRQTIRNWALKSGKVEYMEKSIRNSDHSSEEIQAALKAAKEDGVKKTLEKFSICRATLYNWAAKMPGGVLMENNSESVTVNVEHKGKQRQIVFWKKQVKPPKPPKEKKVRVKKEKPKKENKDKKDLKPKAELPNWAQEFIKKKVPMIKRSDTPEGEVTYLVDNNGTIVEGDGFILSTVNIKEDDPLENKNDISAEDDEDDEEVYEYELDYVDLDLFGSLPYFTPSNSS